MLKFIEWVPGLEERLSAGCPVESLEILVKKAGEPILLHYVHIHPYLKTLHKREKSLKINARLGTYYYFFAV